MKLALKKYFLFVLLTALVFHTKAQVLINEFLASNISINKDNQYNEYSDWIELFNEGTEEFDLSGFSLTDDAKIYGKWLIPDGTTIPANGYLLIWADGKNTGLHTNFKLGSTGEYICLTDYEGAIIDSLSYPGQRADISYGRDASDKNLWLYYSAPSPGAINDTRSYAGIIKRPSLSLPGGFYSGPQTITCSSELPGSFMRYTLDGSEPSSSSPDYSGPISIDSTTVLRIKAYNPGYIPSNVVTATYFIDEGSFTVPVISISAAPADLWDDEIGIYVEGNADCDCGMSLTGNYCCQDWEKEIGIELYEPDGTQAFSQNAGLKIFGSGSRKRIPQRSLSIFARPEYGTSVIDYQLFPDKPIDEFKSFILRSSAHDWIKTMYRDALIQYLTIGYMDLDIQAYRPSVVFINGEYWGIHNIREKMNEDYIAANHGVDPDNVDLLERNSGVIEGDNVAYNQLIDFVSTNDMSQPDNYDYVTSKMDIDEYIDYHILHIYSSKSDWPSNNIKYWRSRTPDGTWRWMAYDMDFGFGLDTERFHLGTYDYNMLELSTDPEGDTWNNPPWSTLLFRMLLNNPEFKNEYIQRFSNHLNTTFESQRLLDMIDSFKIRIEAEIPRHIERWGGAYALELGYVFESLEEWDDNINVMREFVVKRPDYQRQHIVDVFGLTGTADLIVTMPEKSAGYFAVDNVPVRDTLFRGTYFRDLPLTITAHENYGYEFTGWTVASTAPETEILIDYGSEWNYLDDGSDQGSAWNTTDFDDSGWDSGNAQLGYGDGDESTILSYGPNGDNKYITTYFRKEFQVDIEANYNKLIFNFLRDDGAIIYLNGQEIIRSNMPDGEIDYLTTASESVPAVSESNYLTREISSEHLVAGKNVIAVEIHQYSGTSSDISLDLSLVVEGAVSAETSHHPEKEIQLDMDGDYSLTASFETLPQMLFINEFMADNSIIIADDYGEYDDWIEIYNASETEIDLDGFYLTDDLENASLWQIPGGYPDLTTIPASGTILLWADNDPEQGPLHLGFRLNAAGEQIGLSFDGVEYIDSLSFKLQNKDVSLGRTPDGNQTWRSYIVSTPGELNHSTGISRKEFSDNIVSVYPNPTNGLIYFNISAESSDIVNISIIDVLGNVVSSARYSIHNELKVAYDLSTLSYGIYFGIIELEDEVITTRIVYNK